VPGGTTGVAYETRFEATFPNPDGSAFLVTGGTLPPGLRLDVETGALAGIPRQTGSFTFEVAARDGVDPSLPPGRDASYSEDRKTFAIRVELGPPNILSTSMPGAQYRAYYSEPIDLAGGTAPYTWEMVGGSLPAGLAVSPSGVLGTFPTEASQPEYSFRVRVIDATGLQDEADLTVGVVILPLIIQTPFLPGAAVDFPYDVTLTLASVGAGPPYEWSQDLTNVAPDGTADETLLGSIGLELSPDGHVRGRAPSVGATTAGDFTFTAQVVDESGQVAKRQYVLHVSLGPVVYSVTPSHAYQTGPFTVLGANFQYGARIVFKPGPTQTQIVPTWVDATHLRFSDSPPSPGGGAVTVRVVNPDGGYGDLPRGFVFPASTLSFGTKGFVASPLSSTGLAVADFDGDGLAEFVHAGANGLGAFVYPTYGTIVSTAGGLRLHRNNGGLSFSSTTLDTGNFADVEVADVNVDGRPDIVALGHGPSAQVKVWLNGVGGAPAGTFPATPVSSTLAGGSTFVSDMAIGFVNGDAVPDLIFGVPYVRSVGGPLSGSCYSMAGTGTGAFVSLGAATTTITNTKGTSSVALLDVNGDGQDDAVVAKGSDYSSYSSNGPIFYFNQTQSGSGQFSSNWTTAGPTNLCCYGVTTGVAAGDVLGLGTKQVVSAFTTGGYVYSFQHAVTIHSISSGSAVRTTLPAVASPGKCLGVSDLDFDGLDDVVASTNASGLAVWRASSLSLQMTLDASVGSPTVSSPRTGKIAFGDLDGDGRDDLLATTSYWGYDCEGNYYYYYAPNFNGTPGSVVFAGNGGSMGVVYYLNSSN
jgi:hypothetical protein